MYDQTYYQGNAQDADRLALRMYHRLWRRHCPSGPVLEFGCGVGHLARRLSESATTYGLEVNPYALARSRANAPRARLVSSLDELPDACVDSIISLHVLEHIGDAELVRIGDGFNRVLRPGGRLLLVMPDRGGAAHRLKGDNWLALRDPTHVNLKGAGEWACFFDQRWSMRVVQHAADGYYDFPYANGLTGRVFADGWRLARTGVQFLAARLMLRPGDGEACIFLLEKAR